MTIVTQTNYHIYYIYYTCQPINQYGLWKRSFKKENNKRLQDKVRGWTLIIDKYFH